MDIASLLKDPDRRRLALTALVAVGLAAYLSGALRSIYGFDLALILTLIGGFPIFHEAVSGLLSFSISADLAVSLAAVAALAIGQYAVAAEVILIMLIGESLEHFAVCRTRSGIAELLSLRPDTARVRRDGAEVLVEYSELRTDDVVIVRPGDRIPVDGTVLQGGSSVDQSPITGESLPADKTVGDGVFAGTINLYGTIEIAAERLGPDTTLEQIIHLVEEAESAKAPTQRLADRYATWFVPVVILAAGLTYVFTRDVIRSVAVLVVACPCALVLATPTAIAAGIGRLVRQGVLVKGGAVLESLGRLRTVVFDKTGTLTSATLHVCGVFPARGVTEQELLRVTAAVESHSEHPLGKLVVAKAEAEGIAPPAATSFTAHPGLGAEATVEDTVVRVGNMRFLAENDVAVPEDLMASAAVPGATLVLAARDRGILGAIAVRDTVRAEAQSAVAQLRELGVTHIAMLTGDRADAADAVADTLGISERFSELLPADKIAAITRLQQENGPVAMVGDGINDAPSLTAADVGVALADIGTDVAIASSDVVLVGDDLQKLVAAVACGKRVLRTIWQNIIAFALTFNALAVVVAALGWISPVVAAVLHQVSSLVVVCNSLRLLVDWGEWVRGTQQAGRWLSSRRWTLAKAAAGVAGAVYILSGCYTVQVGEAAVVRRFGRVLLPPRGPGLHYRLPVPFGMHATVQVSKARRAEIGFRTMPGVFTEPPAYDWNVQHRGGRLERVDSEATLWTGDENLVDLSMVVQYRINDPVAVVCGLASPRGTAEAAWEQLVRTAGQEALAAELCSRPIEDVLHSARGAIEEGVLARMRAAMAELHRRGPAGAEALTTTRPVLNITRVCLGDVHPPLDVVPAFREVASALEDKEARINRARAYQSEAEALVEGQVAERLRAAESFRDDRIARAHGDAGKFTELAAGYAQNRDLAALRLHFDMIETTLAGRPKVIVGGTPAGRRRMLFLSKDGVWPGARALLSPDESFASPESEREGIEQE